MKDELAKTRGRIAELNVRQVDLARLVGVHPSLLSGRLNGRRPCDSAFLAKVHEALDRWERAEQAAQEAREKVLGEAAL